MDAGALLQQYGYAAVALGSLLEGETFVVLAGYGAHRGYLSLPVVVAVAFVGAVVGDQFWFLVGRRSGASLLARWPRLGPAVARGREQLERHADWFVVLNRFMYGLRTAGPIAIGLSGFAWRRYTVLNTIGAALWAMVVAGAGYVLGEALHRTLGHLHDLEKWVMLGVLAAGVVAAVVLWRRRRATSAPVDRASSGS